MDKHFLLTDSGNIEILDTNLTLSDWFGGIKVRFGIGRYDYRVEPGIYAVGNPDEKSQVLVTANYKLTLDNLRKELGGLDAWILVIDTQGINVWCAAGKGTFGNYELLKIINKVKLKEIVSHNRLILPQLGAPGVAANVIKKAGFEVVYGPVRSKDIKAFLENGMVKTKEMSQVEFKFLDRLVLTPMELIPDIKYALPFFAVLFLFNLAVYGCKSFPDIIGLTLMNFIPLFIALILGSVIVPLLLPYIPFRAFSLKGAAMGVLWSLIFFWYPELFMVPDNSILKLAYITFIMFITSYTALQFTGSSTYTSFSGTTKETVYSIIAGGLLCAAGIILLIIYRLFII
ncbi:MAG: mercury methylation corrinoid protein HgcA [Clostridiaceae bacterium]